MRRDGCCWLAASVLVLGVISASAVADDGYHAEVEAWRKAHEARLRAPDGWLSVSGLHWLNPGQTRLGSDPSNDILLPAHAPAMLGTLELKDHNATFTPAPGTTVLCNGKPFPGGEIHSDHDPHPDVLAIGDLKLLLIERGHRLAFRVKDNQSPIRAKFTGLRWYPVRDDWRIKARFVPYDTPTTITMDTIIGQSESSPSPGYVEFEHDGTTIKLQANEAKNGALWFVFRDKTSGRTTHGGARQLDAAKPENGTVILDFNKAVNLPCAYIPYATCPLAPPQNRMRVAVEAGELKHEQSSITQAARD